MTSSAQTTPPAEAISTRLLALALAAPEGSAFRCWMARAAGESCRYGASLAVDTSISDAAKAIWREALTERLNGQPTGYGSGFESCIALALESLPQADAEGVVQPVAAPKHEVLGAADPA